MSIKIFTGSLWQTTKSMSIYTGTIWQTVQNQWTRVSDSWVWTYTANRWFTADRDTNTITELDIANGLGAAGQTAFSTGRDMESIACKGEQLYMLDWDDSPFLDIDVLIYKINMTTGERTEIKNYDTPSVDKYFRIAGTKNTLFLATHGGGGAIDLNTLSDTGTVTRVKTDWFPIGHDLDFGSGDSNDWMTGTESEIWVLKDATHVQRYNTSGTLQSTYTVSTGQSLRAIGGSKDTLYGLATNGYTYKLMNKVSGTWTVNIELIEGIGGDKNYLAIQKT